MSRDIIDKLREHLSRPPDTEASVVYLMVEIRKAMDRQGTARRYRWLRLFCNWVVHASLNKKSAAAEFLLKAFDVAAAHETASPPILDFLTLSLSGRVVSECPISYNANEMEFERIQSLTLTRGYPDDMTFMRSLGVQPFRIWMCWLVKLKNGTERRWPFYC